VPPFPPYVMKRLKWEELKMGEGLYNSAHLIFHESKELCIKKHVKPLCGNVAAKKTSMAQVVQIMSCLVLKNMVSLQGLRLR
jgi:hypothetical protein